MAGTKVYDELLNLFVWTKTNAGVGSFYRSAHELIFLLKHGTGSHRNNVQLGKFGRYRTNVWSYAGDTPFRVPDTKATFFRIIHAEAGRVDRGCHQGLYRAG